MKKILAVLILTALSASLYLTASEFIRWRNAAREYAILARPFEEKMTYEEGYRHLVRAAEGLQLSRHIALYNLANLQFRLSLRKQEPFLLIAARDNYKEALREKPDFFEAKKNLEIVRSLIRQIEQESEKKIPEDGESAKDAEDKKGDKVGKFPSIMPFEPERP